MSPAPQPQPDPVTRQERRLFDTLLDEVLASLPTHLHELLEEVPLIVEDYPSPEVCDEFKLEYIDDLCGLHDGVPLTQRSVDISGGLPESIHLFREGILSMATDDDGCLDEDELQKQIRITLLHEIGHHFGLDEEDLKKLGYA